MSSPSGPTWTRRVAPARLVGQLGERARHEVDAQLARDAARPLEDRPVERLRARDRLLRCAQHGPFLRQHDQLRAGPRRLPGQPVGGREVAVAIRGRLQLNGGGSHEVLLPNGLTRQSVAEHIVPVDGTTEVVDWVGAFAAEVMLCVAHAQVGPVGRTWWAVWDGSRLHEGTRGVTVSRRRATVRGRLEIDIDARAGDRGHDRAGVDAQDAVARDRHGARADDRRPGLLDESAGRHARRTAWRWSAGAGVAESGSDVVWNLVEGLHDGEPSERTVWVDGEPHAVAHQPFDDLRAVGELRFAAEATRAKRENYLVIASDYEQPFGTFSGSLPVAGALHGWGVMERHSALW